MFEIIKREPILLKRGNNNSKIAGYLHYKKDLLPYFLIEKDYNKNEIYFKWSYRVVLSRHILESLRSKRCRFVVYLYKNFLKTETFYFIVPIEDFIIANASVHNIAIDEEPQVFLELGKYQRIYTKDFSKILKIMYEMTHIEVENE